MQNNKPKAYMLDMDGILYHGEHILPYAIDFVNTISNMPYVFLTNNPTKSPESLSKRLNQLGFSQINASQIITSAQATAIYLSQQTPNFRYFAVGAKGLDEALRQYGTADKQYADYVVVGEGSGIDFEQLSIGINLIVKQGAKLIGTNPDINVDAVCDGQHCILPGGGALVAPFEVATQQKATIIGKPQPLLFEIALNALQETAKHCLMIGDRPDTDIAGAQALGIQTALVRTGRFSPKDSLPTDITPTYDVANLLQLSQQLELKI